MKKVFIFLILTSFLLGCEDLSDSSEDRPETETTTPEENINSQTTSIETPSLSEPENLEPPQNQEDDELSELIQTLIENDDLPNDLPIEESVEPIYIEGFYEGVFPGAWFFPDAEFTLETHNQINSEGHPEIVFIFTSDDEEKFCALSRNPVLSRFSEEENFLIPGSSMNFYGTIDGKDSISSIEVSASFRVLKIEWNRPRLLSTSTQTTDLTYSEENQDSLRFYEDLRTECLGLES